MLATHTLVQLGTPLHHILKHIRSVREHHYQLLHGFFTGLKAEETNFAPPARLHCVTLAEDAAAIGTRIVDIQAQLANLQVDFKNMRRNKGEPFIPDPEDILQTDDILILKGEADDLVAADILLLQGE
jgi:CPA2 family monovalent cation:H+ antiporter-2